MTAVDKDSLKWPQDRPIEVEVGRGLWNIIAICYTQLGVFRFGVQGED